MAWSIDSILAIGAEPTDTEDIRLEKRMLVTVSLVTLPIGFGFGIATIALGQTQPGLIPLSYGILTVANLFLFARTKRYQLFQTLQLVFFLVLPFLVQTSLGGLVAGSVAVVFSIMAPAAALVMRGRRSALFWLAAYCFLVVLGFVLNPDLVADNGLDSTTIGLLMVANLIGAALVVFVTLNYFVGQRDRLRDELAIEQKKSEDLLRNILPAEVAADLKETGGTEAKAVEQATVLFADQVSFVEFSASRDAVSLVDSLNELFTAFDQIAERNGVEKIRTIGDAYMAVAGVPAEVEDHAARMANTALEFLRFVSQWHDVQFRIGLATGPLVAGVVGTSKFQYDIWGDTVNLASRMESSSEPGRVQISESTYQLLRDEFECEPRGTVEVKGRGAMPTWFLRQTGSET